MQINHTLKNDSSGKFYVMYILPHTQKFKLKTKKERDWNLSYVRQSMKELTIQGRVKRL